MKYLHATRHAPHVTEESALEAFKIANLDLFKKDDRLLFQHLFIVIGLLSLGTIASVIVPAIPIKILIGIVNGFFWFCLINVTIHHHQTHRNAASSPGARKVLDRLYRIAVPNAPKRLPRYTRSHLNHHARPFDETDVDHHYGTARFLKMMKNPLTALMYFFELTFVGGHVPGWEDDRYLNRVPLENWNRKDYEEVKREEVKKARIIAAGQWGLFLIAVGAGLVPAHNGRPQGAPLHWICTFAWAWAFPMLLVKNWSHFLGQFQHYDERLLESDASIWRRTKSYRFPSSLNYLAAGEISGHFLHHLFPEMPYYHIETARKRLASQPEFVEKYVII